MFRLLPQAFRRVSAGAGLRTLRQATWACRPHRDPTGVSVRWTLLQVCDNDTVHHCALSGSVQISFVV